MKNNLKQFREFIKFPYNGFEGREPLEWSNFWYDRSNTLSSKRILIVGDSTARMVRSTLAKVLDTPVDLFASSSDIDDELFINQIDAFFNNLIYTYDAIFVQVGHHGRNSKDGGAFEDSDIQRFKDNYAGLINYLLQHSHNIIVETIFDSVIPIKKNTFNKLMFRFKILQKLCQLKILKEKFDDNINRVTRAKNQVILELSKNWGVKYLDINAMVNRVGFIRVDHIHFESEAKEFIAIEMSKMLK